MSAQCFLLRGRRAVLVGDAHTAQHRAEPTALSHALQAADDLGSLVAVHVQQHGRLIAIEEVQQVEDVAELVDGEELVLQHFGSRGRFWKQCRSSAWQWMSPLSLCFSVALSMCTTNSQPPDSPSDTFLVERYFLTLSETRW